MTRVPSLLIRLAMMCIPWGSVSCSLTENVVKESSHVTTHRKFAKCTNYPKTIAVNRNNKLLTSDDQFAKLVKINLRDQRAQLLLGEWVSIDSPYCTSKAGNNTLTIIFPFPKKMKDKRSSIFGSLYRGGSKDFGRDLRKYDGTYDRYVGSSLPYWMRLTDKGIGIHDGKYVYRYPGSNGCARMPQSAVTTIFSKVDKSTPVVVVP